VKAEVDDLRRTIVGNQPVHQLHLAERVVDAGGLSQLRQVVDQRRIVQIDVERRGVSVFEIEIFRQQPRNEGLADAGAGRADDINGRKVHRAGRQRQLCR
jgi:hypothetical protein